MIAFGLRITLQRRGKIDKIKTRFQVIVPFMSS